MPELLPKVAASVVFPDDAWHDPYEEDGDSDGSLLDAVVVVNGHHLFLEAHAVEDRGGMQYGCGRRSNYDMLCDAFDQSAAIDPVQIRGRSYVLFAISGGMAVAKGSRDA